MAIYIDKAYSTDRRYNTVKIIISSYDNTVLLRKQCTPLTVGEMRKMGPNVCKLASRNAYLH